MGSAMSKIKRIGKSALRRAAWSVLDLPKQPGLEIYSLLPASRTRGVFKEVRREAAIGSDVRLQPFYPKSIPKIVWMFWAQGEEAAPFVVRRCIDSWRSCNPDWEVRVLDENDEAFQKLPPLPDGLPYRCRADLFRLALLKEHGGVWIDATVFCHRPLDAWLPLHASSGFFVFGRTLPNRWLDTWFIASEPGGKLIGAWHDVYARYITRAKFGGDVYFMVMYAFEWAVRRDKAAREAWRRCATLPAQPTFVLLSVLKGQTEMSVMADLIGKGLPLSKLSWKAGLSEQKFDEVIAALEANSPAA